MPKGTRSKRRGGKGFAGRAWAVPAHLLNATGNSVKVVGHTAGNVTRRVLLGARQLGNTWVGHTTAAVRNVTRGGRRKGRKGGKRGVKRH